MPEPSVRTVLQVLSKARIQELGREIGASLPAEAVKDAQIAALEAAGQVKLPQVLPWLGRDELKAACRAHGLDDSGRARSALAARLLGTDIVAEAPAPYGLFMRSGSPGEIPRPGDIALVRQRQYLVEGVVPPLEPGQATRVQLVCLDDDNQGSSLEVMWELELGAKVLSPEAVGLGEVPRIDPPRLFTAYLHALKWNAVTATDARLFQAPFRAGIKLMNHQLTPLKKALELPRANLFIADDVGLGKTIEAGLVLQELLLRQRVEFVLIICPAAVCLQWKGEMEKRFGLRFEIYNRAFIARRRQQRGFGVNPWSTHNRFIISYQTFRRPEYRDPLLQHLGERARRSLLILDEAHTAAPSSASKYAVDSRVTRVIRDAAPRFENRLFLSATPHNGHSNSFSALLEILDPQRFTRGVPVTGAAQLEPVMVRRLKADLRRIGCERFPERRVVQIDLVHEAGTWTAREACGKERGAVRKLAEAEPHELILSRLLVEYTALMKPRKGSGQLVFTNLQKRLLSSVEAFFRTLALHAKSVAEGKVQAELELPFESPVEEDEYGEDEAQEEAREGAEIEALSRRLATPAGRARELLAEMLRIAECHRATPDAKALALLAWIREHQCRGVRLGGATGKGTDLAWTDRRVIVFTEYGDTKRYLFQLLSAAVSGTRDDDLRILQFHGGMSDDQREEVQRAFNSPPGDHLVRILVATDAAREGVNLQGHCADLFHYDVPWNPARMEQRNGRIDRTLQPAPEVRCHYFFYPQREEDMVLRKLVEKVDTIQRELGSLGSVVMERLESMLENGIAAGTGEKLDALAVPRALEETARKELESPRQDLDRLRHDIDEAGLILNRSREVMEFDPALLRDAIDVGLELAGADPLRAIIPGGDGGPAEAWELPELADSWQPTLDTLRPPKAREMPFWEWRKTKPQPVVFHALDQMNSALVHLHLEHPLVQRILSRFLAQGYGAHDLARVTVVRNPNDSLVRVIAFGRLSLFGSGATRLHDRLVSVAAPWLESDGPGHLKPFSDRADRKAIDTLEQLLAASPSLDGVSTVVLERLRRATPAAFAALWPHIRDEADHLAHEASRQLGARAAEESAALRRILETQRTAIEATIKERAQLVLDFTDGEKAERDQYEQDRRYMERRLGAIDREIETEPPQIEELYRVVLRRLVPVGLVWLWPETRG